MASQREKPAKRFDTTVPIQLTVGIGGRIGVLLRVAPGKTVDDVHAANYLTEDRVVPLREPGRPKSDEELAAVGVWSSVGHGYNPGFVECQVICLVCKLITWSSRARTGRIAALSHKSF